MRIDKRVERNTQSVIAMRDYFREIVQNPAAFSGETNVGEVLKSQGRMSKFDDNTRGISASSLNTVKRIAESAIEGGFDALDRLRIAAHEAIIAEQHKEARSNKLNKLGLTKRVQELELENQQLRQDLLCLTLAFEKSLSQGSNYALRADNNSVLALCGREQRELRDMLSLRQHPLRMNVTSIDDA